MSSSMQLYTCELLLEQVATLLKRTRQVTFLADRRYRDRDGARTCHELNEDYLMRMANNTTITFADGRTTTADHLHIKPDQCRYLARVRLTLAADGAWNLAMT